ncbi:hypothetical protein DFJ43DRAFT_985978, partial [Lentinula guzmanii]
TIITPNHKSTLAHADLFIKYINNDLARGRINGPFSKEETEVIVRSPFIYQPVTVVMQD